MAAKLALVLAIVVLGAAAACGGGDEGEQAAPAESTAPAATTTAPAETAEPITIELKEVNKSGQSGTATLVPGKVGDIETLKVILEIEPVLDSPQMAHVHRVTCAEYAKIKGIENQIGTIHAPLADLRDGKSEMTVPGSIATGQFSINVHKPESPFPAVACGDIPKLSE